MLHVSPAALDISLEHIEHQGDTDIFPLPFEYAAIREDWAALRPFLAAQDRQALAVLVGDALT